MPIYEAATIDEAIQLGLNDLGLDKEKVEIEILDEGKKDFWGSGVRMLVLRLNLQLVKLFQKQLKKR